MSGPLLIHVVDDDKSLRTALLRLLGEAGYEVEGYGSAGEFLLQEPPDRPGCLLLDIRMPGPSGLDLQKALQRRCEWLPIVFLTGHGGVADGVEAMRAGAVDFLIKPVERATLFQAIERALARDATARAVRAQALQLRARFDSLTPREQAVLDLLVTGKSNKQIADMLGIAERTAKLHRAQLRSKLGAASAAELGVLAERIRHLPD
jgi:FixJ family two-component response regulator